MDVEAYKTSGSRVKKQEVEEASFGELKDDISDLSSKIAGVNWDPNSKDKIKEEIKQSAQRLPDD